MEDAKARGTLVKAGARNMNDELKSLKIAQPRLTMKLRQDCGAVSGMC